MNDTSLLVSIIIPAYNAAAYLEETLRSVLNQTYRDIEMVVVDDGSTDGTGEIAQALAGQDARVRYVRQKNQGQSAARKQGLFQSKGSWVTFLDADNILLPRACETVAERIQSGGGDVYYGDIRYFETETPRKLFIFPLHYASEVTLESLVEHNFINFLGTFIRREKVLDCFDERFRRADDHVVWLKLILKGAAFQYVPSVLGHLRFHRKNLSFEKSYLIETAETNLALFDWLEGEARKKYRDPRLQGILARIEIERGAWGKKGYLGALILQERKEALTWLARWHKDSQGSVRYRLLRALTFAAPLFLVSPLLQYMRRKLVMRKYTPIVART